MDNTMEEQSTEPKGGAGKKNHHFRGHWSGCACGGYSFLLFLYPNPSYQVLVRVNGEKITVDQFNKELAKVDPPLIREMLREEPNNLLERMIVKTLLLQEAKKQGVSAPVKTYKDAEKNPLPLKNRSSLSILGKSFLPRQRSLVRRWKDSIRCIKIEWREKPLKEVAPAIEQYIREAKQQQVIAKFLEEVRKNAKVDIDQDRLTKITTKPPEMDTEDDLKKALAGGKPVLVDFGANSCLPCRQMRPVLKEVRIEYSEKAKILVIDVYKNQNLAREHKVLMLPTLVFFDSKGKEAFRHVGILEKEKIVAKLKEIGMET